VGLRPDPIASVERGADGIRDPVAKLKYLRGNLERFEKLDERFQAVPFAPVRWALYRLTGLKGARALFSTNPNGALATPPRRRPVAVATRARRAANWAALLLAVAGGLAIAAYPRPRPAASVALPLPPVAEELPPPPPGITPEGVWRVDSGDGFELYSNGLRIDTAWTVPSEKRRYRTFSLTTGMESEVQEKPVGIVFHTSESDIWPLEESFNEKLRDSSHGLLRYLSRKQVYHYLVDRFGQVFRVVKEEERAHHAGMSIWSKGDRVWLNLNGGFIGISFETRWAGGRALPITRAQLEAGRRLTDYLRDKWEIPGDMCVTHGLTSVNPHKHLIGHHVDWARGFPFEAYGLPDLYRRPPPSVALFGFGYDEPFLQVMGEPWPGVRDAERALAGESASSGRSLEDVRKEKKELYDRWLAKQTREAKDYAKRASTGIASGRAPSQGD